MVWESSVVYRLTRAQKDRFHQIALCTCPWCYYVWGHTENPGQPTFDLQRTKEQYGNPHDVFTCPNCESQSVADILREKRLRYGQRVVPPQRGR